MSWLRRVKQILFSYHPDWVDQTCSIDQYTFVLFYSFDVLEGLLHLLTHNHVYTHKVVVYFPENCKRQLKENLFPHIWHTVVKCDQISLIMQVRSGHPTPDEMMMMRRRWWWRRMLVAIVVVVIVQEYERPVFSQTRRASFGWLCLFSYFKQLKLACHEQVQNGTNGVKYSICFKLENHRVRSPTIGKTFIIDLITMGILRELVQPRRRWISNWPNQVRG